MLRTYTARYTQLSAGDMGQLVEWPEVVTEGDDLDDCRAMLRDALREMMLACRDLGEPIPFAEGVTEPLAVEVEDVRQPAGC